MMDRQIELKPCWIAECGAPAELVDNDRHGGWEARCTQCDAFVMPMSPVSRDEAAMLWNRTVDMWTIPGREPIPNLEAVANALWEGERGVVLTA